MPEPAPNVWRCTVCGHIHREGDPPEWCPVCGAEASAFQTHADEAPAPAPTPGQWRCLNCHYVHEGDSPPDACPVCGAASDRFEAVAAQTESPAAVSGTRKVVVLGAGIAGVSVVEVVRRASSDAEITLVSKEQRLPYYRLNLTRYLAGDVTGEQLPIHPAGWYEENRIELLPGAEAVEILPDDGTVVLRDGGRLECDELILAIGAHPFIPPVPGIHRDGVLSLRTVRDAEAILDTAESSAACAVVSGGLLGLETAGALAQRGVEVTLLESHEWLMPRQLNRTAGELLQARLGDMGIRVRTQACTEEIVGDERVAGVLLTDGDTVPAGLVVIATGVRSNSYLARSCGLEVNRGVVVDHYLRTSHPRILAAGDVAEHRGTLYGHWAASQYQGSIAGMNAAGLNVEFGGLPPSSTLKVLGVDLMSVGQFEPEDGSFDVIESADDGDYLRFVFHDGRLVGAVLLGDAAISGPLTAAIESGEDLSGLLSRKPDARAVRDHLAEAG